MFMQVKILCLNVWIGGILFEQMVDFLNAENPDILLLQEVFDGKDTNLPVQTRTFDELKKRLPELKHACFAPTMIDDVDGKDIVQGNAVMSKFPLEQQAVIHYDVPFGKRINEPTHFHVSPRSLQHVVAHVGEKKLHVFNTQGIWGEDGDDNERRLMMSKKIIQAIGDLSPVVLAGDLNVQEGTQTVLNIEKKLKNVFYRELKTSFNLQRKNLDVHPGFAEATVDMMFVSPDVKVLNKRVPQVDVSDHLPLFAEIEI